ncbi:MAG: hypothetical protein P1V97_00365 [Planctomycetota bacterium]|nr:hypothetical protein [Planctomycetota bacterium]
MTETPMPPWLAQTLRPLLLAPAFELLQSIIERATRFEVQDKTVTMRFEDPELELSPEEIFCIQFKDNPTESTKTTTKTPSTASEALAETLSIAPLWSFGEIGDTGQIVLSEGKNGTLHCLGSDAWNEKLTKRPYSPNIFSPIDIDLQAYLFRHPNSGDYILYDEVIETCRSQDPMEIFLSLVYNRIDESQH